MLANYVKHLVVSVELRHSIANAKSLNHAAHGRAGLIVYRAK